jgi:type II secretory pathway pseudopilin PulG
MIILEVIFVIGLAALIALFLVNKVNESRQQRQLNEAFYRLLETQNSQVSLIQLAASARVDAQFAEPYLKRQAQVFSAVLEVDDQGYSFYQFPKLRLPPSSDQEW